VLFLFYKGIIQQKNNKLKVIKKEKTGNCITNFPVLC